MIGRGGTGCVYEARAERDGAMVAIKVAHLATGSATALLRREGDTLRIAGPPHVPEVLETGLLADGRSYLVMERPPHPTLADLLAPAARPMELDRFRRAADAFLGALQALHRRGLVHRDLKPGNILLDLSRPHAWLIDLGLTERLDAPAAAPPPIPEAFRGTVEYAAPEQCAGGGAVDARTDLYAAGAIFYEMLTGRPPFVGSAAEVKQAHLARRPAPPSTLAAVPDELEQLVLRCLAKQPADRFARVEELRGALSATGGSRARPRTPTPHRLRALPKHERRSVGLVFFESEADPGRVQALLASLSGQLGDVRRHAYVAVFGHESDENPVRLALRAARSLVSSKLAVRALVDLEPVAVQVRPDGARRYVSAAFSRKERFPDASDPSGVLMTTAAAVVADLSPELARGDLLRTRALKARGSVRRHAGGDAWSVAADELGLRAELPLIEWLTHRELDAMPANLVAHARLAALLGGDFTVRELAGVLRELDREGLAGEFPLDAEVGVERLVEQGLLCVQQGRIGFVHALVQAAVDRSVPAGMREPVRRAALRVHREAALDDSDRARRPARAMAPSLDRDDDQLDETKVFAPQGGLAPCAGGGEGTLAPGCAAGAYVISRLIGTGGAGTVYAAEHRVLGRKVALKVLHQHLVGVPELTARFVQEARAVNLIRHPGIVDIHDFDTLEDGRPFYVMELIDGISLGTLLAQRDPLTPREALRILGPICDALGAAHAKGVVHRDVKASNVLVVDRGPERQVKLLDFGIAKILHPDPGQRGITTQEQRLGTPHYMAPEQLRGDPVDARTDVYALGVLLFRMLTRSYPFHSPEVVEIERMHLETPPPPPSQRRPVSPAIDAVVRRAMDKHPDRRFASAAAFQAALRLAVDAPAAAPAEPEVSQAIGIYVELRVPDQDGELDQAMLSDLASMLDLAALELERAGFTLALQTGVAILGARTSPPGALGENLARGLQVADRLFDALARRPEPDARIRFNVCLHVDRVSLQVAPGGKPHLAGPLLQIAAWAPESDLTTLCVTEEATRMLSGTSAEAHGGRYLLVRRRDRRGEGSLDEP